MDVANNKYSAPRHNEKPKSRSRSMGQRDPHRPGARKSCTHPVEIETDITRFRYKVHRSRPRMREGCMELWPQSNLRLVCWTLKSCRESVEAEQFISEYELEMRVRAVVAAILDVGGHPTDNDVVVTSPFATGTYVRTDEEVKGRPFEDGGRTSREQKYQALSATT